MIPETQYMHSVLTQDEQMLQEVLNAYGDKSILPDKDQTAKLMLLKVFLKKQLLQLLTSDPSVSFKKAILGLVSMLPDDSREEAFHLAVSVVSKHWLTLVSNSQETEISG